MADNALLTDYASTIISDILPLLYSKCFDCSSWSNIELLLINIDRKYPDNDGVLIKISKFLTTTDTSISPISEITDYGFRTQVCRLNDIITDLINKIHAINCNQSCSSTDLLSQFEATIVTTLLQIVSTLEYLNGLLSVILINSSSDCSSRTGCSTTIDCGCTGNRFFEILMGRFINSITHLQNLMQDWYSIVMSFFALSSMPTKPYVAAYMPNTPISVPQPPQSNGFACVPCPPPPPPQNCHPVQNNCTPYHPCY